MMTFLILSLFIMYELGMMIKLRKASNMTKPEIRSTFVSGSGLLITIERQTRPVMNSKDQEKTVI